MANKRRNMDKVKEDKAGKRKRRKSEREDKDEETHE